MDQISIKNTVLSGLNLKNTKARSGVLEILNQRKTPLDAGEIALHLKREGVETNLATVYRILDISYKKGLVDRLEFQEGKFRFELPKGEHHHLICENCGAIEDFSDCSLSDLEKEIGKKKGFSVKRHCLEFYGFCKNCS